MPKEYIEREVALNKIKKLQKTDPATVGKKQFSEGYFCGLDEAEIVLLQTPTADVQEVRHGKNITKIKPVDEFECSECGFICEICENIYYDDCICHREYNPEFCPNCGAKMDKE